MKKLRLTICIWSWGKKQLNMDNYVDCSQCPGIYGRTTAIYDPVEDTNENRSRSWNRLVAMLISEPCFTSESFLSIVSLQKVLCWSVLKRICEILYCNLETFAIHCKNFSRCLENFLKWWSLFPSPQTFLAWSKFWKRRWKDPREADKYGSLDSSVTFRL